MSIFSKLVQKYNRATPKQLLLTGVFMLALAGAIGSGFAGRATSSAAMPRDCDNNSIMRCGFADGNEFLSKANANAPGDLDNVYGHVGVPVSSYSDFAANAKQGTFYRDGRVDVDGETVVTGGKSMGHHNYGGSSPLSINGKTYYYGSPSQRWGSSVQSIPAMVWFDDNGVVRAIIMNPCGNPLPYYEKRTPFVKCEALNKHDVAGKKNTYRFSTTSSKDGHGLARYVKFNYYLNNETQPFATTTDPATLTNEITLTKTSTVRVEIEFTLPGSRNKIRTVKSDLCKRVIEVKQFSYVCERIITNTSDNKTFRFSAKPQMSEGVSVVSADFVLDNKTPVTVTDDEDQNGYKQYTVTVTEGEHTVKVAKMIFMVDGETKTVVTPSGKCMTKVTRDRTPECKPGIPVGDERCKDYCKPGIPVGDARCQDYCKPGIPVNDARCKDYCKPGVEVGKAECEELPSTGPAGVASLFAGVTAAGAVGHRLLMNYRSRREQ